MTPSLHAFMAGLIDYAGLFPPAKLDLEPAISNYARYRQEGDAWMLGRFIIPVARLGELDAHANLFGEGEPARFSVLGHPALEQNVFKSAERTVEDAAAFEARYDGQLLADMFELKLQPEILELSAIIDLFGKVHTSAADKLLAPTRAFAEAPLMGDRWQAGMEKSVRAIADANDAAGHDQFGLKMRCGGVTADAFPDVEAIAFAVLMARDAEIPFKATAGLHHPVRFFSEEVDAMMHGFLNVFGGAILAKVHGFDESTLTRMLTDELAEHFTFSHEGFSWMEWSASTEDITAARDAFATSYGSCSFDDPRDDLAALGMLDRSEAE